MPILCRHRPSAAVSFQELAPGFSSLPPGAAGLQRAPARALRVSAIGFVPNDIIKIQPHRLIHIPVALRIALTGGRQAEGATVWATFGIGECSPLSYQESLRNGEAGKSSAPMRLLMSGLLAQA